MEFPLNRIKLDSYFINAVQDETESSILAGYAMFKKLSSLLMNTFEKDRKHYGTTALFPPDITKKYKKLFTELFEDYKNLGEDLQRQVNRNSELLEEILHKEGPESFFYKIARRKQEKLHGKIQYFNTVKSLCKEL